MAAFFLHSSVLSMFIIQNNIIQIYVKMIINEKYLKEYSPIPNNYNMTEIMNYVDISEKIWILPIIGYEQYEELQEQVKSNTLTPENSTLLVEALYPLLGFAVVYEALPSIAYHVSEISITKGHSDNSTAIDLKEMTYFIDHIRRQLEVRKDFAIKWICEHIDSFPLVDCCSCGCDCCNDNAKLEEPNPNYMLYTTKRKNTNLR